MSMRATDEVESRPHFELMSLHPLLFRPRAIR